MTNFEIIEQYLEENEINFEYTGTNLMTFAQWKKAGLSVKKGETAFVKIELWTFKEVEEKDENNKVILDENGKPKKKKKFFLKSAALFTESQVEKAKKAAKKKKAA